jgi:hypothetical protein
MGEIMLIEVLQKQYTKSFSILKKAISIYDETIWLNHVDYKSPAWQIVYHTLFYANIYCSSSENDIVQWNILRTDYHDFRKTHELEKNNIISLVPYTKTEMMEFAIFIEGNIPGYLSKMRPDEKCWPFWYDESQLEFHINNLRHIQHHIGEIIERHDIKKDMPYIWE